MEGKNAYDRTMKITKRKRQRKEPGKETENNQQGRYQEIFKKQRKSEYSISEATGKVMKLRQDNVKYCQGSSEIKTERCSLDLVI